MTSSALRAYLCCVISTCTWAPLACQVDRNRESGAKRPNVILIVTDDQGYGDLSCMGHPTIHTPHIDALARGGRRFLQFYVASPVCSPSRAAFLAGCYPKRVGMHEHVVFPEMDRGLHADEVTIADMLKSAGYRTACFGKWHLGHRLGMLPPSQGFDRWAGIPYSNDMAQRHRKTDNKYRYRLPWLTGDANGSKVEEWEPDQRQFTRRITDATVAFIEENAKRPFFAYIPHPMPHIPIYASEDFRGTSKRGLYGDVIEEIDAGVGTIVAALRKHEILDDTIVIFTSDNGPWLQFKNDGGSAGLLRDGKGTNFEGGQRVPCVIHWPARIPADTTSREVMTAMDLLPTLARIVGVELDAKRRIDGHVALSLWEESGAPSPTEAFVYYSSRGALAGIRRGPWKLLLSEAPAADRLYQIEHDVSERVDMAEREPDLVAELRALAQSMDAEITAHARPAGRADTLVFDPRK